MPNKEYMLKDVTRYQALCAALPEFAANFQRSVNALCGDGVDTLPIPVIGDDGEWRVDIPRSEIIAIQHYDPERWNRWDEVDAPVGVPLRVEVSAKEDFSFPTRFVGRFSGREWLSDSDWENDVDLTGKFLRFRPFIGPNEVQ
ncbi:hypothetical protein [uncultured Sutterella sp.]|uniref:hypothetical protein n=1 Tax=uncultured Sutterella sp. TaxID=286133 RepID=UPI00266C8216|nr:hypothetical protein [uncultured Sutterella sp.]